MARKLAIEVALTVLVTLVFVAGCWASGLPWQVVALVGMVFGGLGIGVAVCRQQLASGGNHGA